MEMGSMQIDQTTINITIGVVFSVVGWILKTLYGVLTDLQHADSRLAEKVQSIELLVAGQYIQKDEFERLSTALFAKLDKIDDKKDEFQRLINAVFTKLDRLENKLDNKMDKKP